MTPASGSSGNLDTYARCNELARSIASRITDPEWRLEVSKSVWEDDHLLLGLARGLRDQHPVEVPPGLRDRVRLAAFRSRSRVAAYRARHRVSAVLAAAAVTRTLARSRPRRPTPGRPMIALHGELSNRTKNVLAIARASEAPHTLIVLGRPKGSLAALADELRAHGLERFELVRPFDLASGARAVSDALAAIQSAREDLGRTGYAQGWRDEIASLYRLWLGAAAARWWSRQGVAPRDGVVLFGHTGLADTSALERAMQAGGIDTVHVVHGISGGWHFVARSSLGLFRCGHDARMHRSFGGYAACTHLPLDQPSSRRGRGLLLFTNYIHPANPFFGSGAVELGYRSVRMSLQAWRRVLPTERFCWRPHPMFWTFGPDVTGPLVEEVVAAGGIVSRPDDPFPDPGEWRAVLSTPSTTIIDALVAGATPILVAPHQVPPEVVYSALPLAAADAESLCRALERLLADRAHSLFETTWTAVQPGRAPATWEDIGAALRDSGAAD